MTSTPADPTITKLNANDFFMEVTSLVETQKVSFIDAVVHLCSMKNIEIETAASLIKSSPRFKATISEEGEALNLLAKITKVEFE